MGSLNSNRRYLVSFPSKISLGTYNPSKRNPYAHFGGKTKSIMVFLNKAYTCVPCACVFTLNTLCICVCVSAPQYLNLMVLGRLPLGAS